MLGGKPGLIRDELNALRVRMNISKRAGKAAREVVQAATKQLENEFVAKFAGDYSGTVLKMVGAAEKSIAANLQAEVRRLTRAKAGDEEVRQALKRVAGVQEQHVAAVVETTNAGFRRGQYFADALEAGAEKFKFVGRSGIRPFWLAYGNKILTIDEWRKTSNGQNLEPLFYGCGYRCGHRFMAVF